MSSDCDRNIYTKLLTELEKGNAELVYSGQSLHCWDEVYKFEGKIYRVTGTFYSDEVEVICE